MFKTMDNTSVYDKKDIDQTLGVPEAGATGTAFERIAETESRLTQAEARLNRKADSADITPINEALTQKVNRSEIGPMVQAEVNDIVNTKVNEIAGTFGDTIDGKIAAAITAEDIPGKVSTALSGYDTSSQVTGKIETALAGYDDSNAVDTKISTAIGNIPAGPSAMTTSEATALINTYF